MQKTFSNHFGATEPLDFAFTFWCVREELIEEETIVVELKLVFGVKFIFLWRGEAFPNFLKVR